MSDEFPDRPATDSGRPRGCWLWCDYPGGDLINSWVQGRKAFQLARAGLPRTSAAPLAPASKRAGRSLSMDGDWTAPGWREIDYAPVFAGEFAEGTVDTPFGPIHSRWRRGHDGVRLTLDLPPGCLARLSWDGAPRAMVSGSWQGVIASP